MAVLSILPTRFSLVSPLISLYSSCIDFAAKWALAHFYCPPCPQDDFSKRQICLCHPPFLKFSSGFSQLSWHDHTNASCLTVFPTPTYISHFSKFTIHLLMSPGASAKILFWNPLRPPSAELGVPVPSQCPVAHLCLLFALHFHPNSHVVTRELNETSIVYAIFFFPLILFYF